MKADKSMARSKLLGVLVWTLGIALVMPLLLALHVGWAYATDINNSQSVEAVEGLLYIAMFSSAIWLPQIIIGLFCQLRLGFSNIVLVPLLPGVLIWVTAFLVPTLFKNGI